MGFSGFAMLFMAIMSYDQAEQARRHERQAAQAQRNQRMAEFRRQQMQARREAQIKRSQMEASALAFGGGGGSGLAGGVGSLQTQLNSNLSFGQSMAGITNYIYDQQGQAIDAQSRAAFYGSMASYAGSYYTKT